MIRKMYCIETDKNSLYVDKDVYDYIVSLEQQCIKQKEVIDEAIEYIKENVYSYYDSTGEKYIEETVFERSANPKKLLEILNGEDKEVPE